MTMKAPLSLAALLLLAALAAQAQPALPLAITNAIPALGTNTANVELPAAEVELIGLQLTYGLAAAVGVNSNVTATVQQSLDGTNWVDFTSLARAASGTNLVSTVTNLSVYAIPRFRISTIINANTVAVERLTFWRSIKPRR